MRNLGESHAGNSKGIVFGISGGQGSRLLFCQSQVDHSSEGDNQSACQFLAIRASSIVRIDITSNCAISFSCSSDCSFSKFSSTCSSKCSSKCSSQCSSKCYSKCSSKCSCKCSYETESPVLCAVEVAKHALESYHMLLAQVVIIPAENSDDICDIKPSGGHSVHEASDHRLEIWSDRRLLCLASSCEALLPLVWDPAWTRPCWMSPGLSECSCADGCWSCDAPDCVWCLCRDRRRHSRDHASGTSPSSDAWSAQWSTH